MSELVSELRRVAGWLKAWDPDEGNLLITAADRVEALEVEVERLTESRSTIARGLEREEELNADLEAEVERLREALTRVADLSQRVEVYRIAKAALAESGKPLSDG
jgi:hypothetical protein